jgi:hypothetical protein
MYNKTTRRNNRNNAAARKAVNRQAQVNRAILRKLIDVDRFDIHFEKNPGQLRSVIPALWKYVKNDPRITCFARTPRALAYDYETLRAARFALKDAAAEALAK